MDTAVDTGPKRRSFFQTKSPEERTVRAHLKRKRQNWVKATKHGTKNEGQRAGVEYADAVKALAGCIARERGAAAAAQFEFSEKSIFGAKNRERLWQNRFVKLLAVGALGAALIAIGITLSAASLPAIITAVTTFGKVLAPKILHGLLISLSIGVLAGFGMGWLLSQTVFIKRAARREGISPKLLTEENYQRTLKDAEVCMKKGMTWDEFRQTESGKIIGAMTRINIFKRRTRIVTGAASSGVAFGAFHHGWGAEIVSWVYGSPNGADTMFASVSEIEAAHGVMRVIGDRFAEFFIALVAVINPISDVQARGRGGGNSGRGNSGRGNSGNRYGSRNHGHDSHGRNSHARSRRWRKLIMIGWYIMMYDDVTGKMERHLVTENDPLLEEVPKNIEIYPDRPRIPKEELYSEIKKNGSYFAVVNTDGAYSVFHLDAKSGRAELVTDKATDLSGQYVDKNNVNKDILLLRPDEVKNLSAVDRATIAQGQKRLEPGYLEKGKSTMPQATPEEVSDLYKMQNIDNWGIDAKKELDRMIATMQQEIKDDAQSWWPWDTFIFSDLTWEGKKFKTAFVLGERNRTSMMDILRLICGSEYSYTRTAEILLGILDVDNSFNSLPIEERKAILNELYDSFDASDYDEDGGVTTGGKELKRDPKHAMIIALIDMLYNPEGLKARCPHFYTYMRQLINNHPLLRKIIMVK
ncbi:MAG: hypothetical protein AAB573_01285 [Patescibacteria group bacterium]